MGVVSDPIADLLARIRNAIMAGHRSLNVPASKIKYHIVDILQQEGFIQGFEQVTGDVQGSLEITLKYHGKGENAIQGLKRVSKPGRRIYTRSGDIPRVRNGLGVAILSTPKGVVTGRVAREQNVGGEVLCYIW